MPSTHLHCAQVDRSTSLERNVYKRCGGTVFCCIHPNEYLRFQMHERWLKHIAAWYTDTHTHIFLPAKEKQISETVIERTVINTNSEVFTNATQARTRPNKTPPTHTYTPVQLLFIFVPPIMERTTTITRCCLGEHYSFL